MNNSNEYRSWQAMKSRCLNPKAKDFSRYGGAGIKVCDRWMKFENFFEDMGPRPDGYSIERLDNQKDYSPENCKWADDKTQSNNRSSNRLIEIHGHSLTLAQWEEKKGLTKGIITKRLSRGWSPEKAVLTPVLTQFRREQSC